MVIIKTQLLDQLMYDNFDSFEMIAAAVFFRDGVVKFKDYQFWGHSVAARYGLGSDHAFHLATHAMDKYDAWIKHENMRRLVDLAWPKHVKCSDRPSNVLDLFNNK